MGAWGWGCAAATSEAITRASRSVEAPRSGWRGGGLSAMGDTAEDSRPSGRCPAGGMEALLGNFRTGPSRLLLAFSSPGGRGGRIRLSRVWTVRATSRHWDLPRRWPVVIPASRTLRLLPGDSTNTASVRGRRVHLDVRRGSALLHAAALDAGAHPPAEIVAFNCVGHLLRGLRCHEIGTAATRVRRATWEPRRFAVVAETPERRDFGRAGLWVR